MQEFFRFAGLSVKTSRSCAEEAISLTATSPKKLYKHVQSKRITLEELGMDPVDVEMVMEALWQAFPSYRKRFAGRLKVRRMDDNSYAEDDSYFDGPDSSNEFKSDGSEDITRMDDRSTSSRSPSTTTDNSSNRRRRSSHTSDVRISDYTLQQQQIHRTTSNVQLTQRELEEERERQQQLLIARNRPHSYYPSSYFNSLTYIEGDGPHDSHMLKLHSNGAEDGILNPFHSSAHSMGVSHALASLPSRPSSAHRPSNGVTVHTEMLLMRVASILKTRHGQ